ncbi:unnamed protein product, partial [marine sediment metagenome]
FGNCPLCHYLYGYCYFRGAEEKATAGGAIEGATS